MPSQRVTVTLPSEMVRNIDNQERNRSSFILVAVQREFQRRRREALRRSLLSPHPESHEMAERGMDKWVTNLPDDGDDLLDPEAGRDVRWIPDEGWVEAGE